MKIVEMQYIIEHGINLEAQGIKEWALSREHVVKSLIEIKDKEVIVLGGDVLIKEGNNYNHNYDSWHYEPDLKFSRLENVERSILKAESYIENYQPISDENYFFVLSLKW